MHEIDFENLRFEGDEQKQHEDMKYLIKEIICERVNISEDAKPKLKFSIKFRMTNGNTT